MNDCPRQNPAYRSASLFIKPRFGGVFAFRIGQMNDCPRRYAQKNAAYRSASLFIKPRFGGVFAFRIGQMSDCPRGYAQKNAASRSASLFIKPRFGGVFAFWAGCYAWWRCAYQAYRDGWNGFCRPDKVFTPPSGRRYICRVTLGLTRLWRLFSLHLLFIWPLFMRWMSFIWGNAL